MNRFIDRVTSSIMITVGILAALDSQGIDFDVQGIVGVSVATIGLAYLLMPKAEES